MHLVARKQNRSGRYVLAPRDLANSLTILAARRRVKYINRERTGFCDFDDRTHIAARDIKNGSHEESKPYLSFCSEIVCDNIGVVIDSLCKHLVICQNLVSVNTVVVVIQLFNITRQHES